MPGAEEVLPRNKAEKRRRGVILVAAFVFPVLTFRPGLPTRFSVHARNKALNSFVSSPDLAYRCRGLRAAELDGNLIPRQPVAFPRQPNFEIDSPGTPWRWGTT